MNRRWKDCDKCRLTAHEGRCAQCGGSGTIPCCPPIAEMVVICYEEGTYPLLVLQAERRGEPAEVFVGGLAYRLGWKPVPRMNVPGPSSEPGHWNWKGDPS